VVLCFENDLRMQLEARGLHCTENVCNNPSTKTPNPNPNLRQGIAAFHRKPKATEEGVLAHCVSEEKEELGVGGFL